MSRISVIIPVYEAERTIARCLDSLESQTLTDWEAVCINDGSKDRTREILDTYAAADRRFVVLHKPNGGAASARNTGITLAKGEYLMFLDADDFLHPQTLELTLAAAVNNGSDLVCFSSGKAREGRMKIKRYNPLKAETQTTSEVFRYAADYPIPWHCLYLASVVKDLRFPKAILYERIPWWGEALKRVTKATLMRLPLYFHAPSPGSSINSASLDDREIGLCAAMEYAELLFASDEERSAVPGFDCVCPKNTPADETTPLKSRLWEENFLVPLRADYKKIHARRVRYDKFQDLLDRLF